MPSFRNWYPGANSSIRHGQLQRTPNTTESPHTTASLRDRSRKLAVVWGDSVVFGVRWSWPCLIDEFAPGYQFLNDVIEGDPYTNILRRAAEFNRAHLVSLNILLPGWHPWRLPQTLAERNTRVGGQLARLRRGGGLGPRPRAHPRPGADAPR